MTLPRELAERAASIAATVLAEEVEATDASARWPARAMRALQAERLAGLVVPVEAGGYGAGLLAVAELCELLGARCASTGISFGMHLVGSAVIAAKATDHHRARYLEPIAAGQHLTTLALSEPGTGAHFYLPETRLRRAGDDGYAVTGVKSFVTNGGHADSYVMSVATEDGALGAGEFSCVVVPGDTPRMSWGDPWVGWGMRGNSAREVRLDGAPLGRDALLGEEGDEIWYVFSVIAPFFLMAMAGTYLGVAQAALDHAVAHLRRRTYSHSGAPLASSVVLQHRVGTLWAEVRRTRALVHAAARAGDAGEPDALAALCAAKAEVADAAERVTAESMTLLGGAGYAREHPIHRLYRDVRAAHVMAPTTDLLRTWTGRAILGLPLLGEQ